MRNKKPRKIEDDFAPEGTQDCKMKCDRKIISTKEGPVVVCNGCMRVVIDNRKKNEY